MLISATQTGLYMTTKQSTQKAPESSMSEVFTHSNTKYRLTIKKTVRGFYRAYAEVKLSTHMELVDLSSCMPDRIGKKLINIKQGSTYGFNPTIIARQYIEGIIDARELQISLLDSWGLDRKFTDGEYSGVKMLQEAIQKSKEVVKNDK
jgi:hypothetical protein